MSILQTIESDITNAWKIVEGAVETDATVLWNDVKPLVLAVEPAVYADLKVVIAGILKAFAQGTSLADLETALLNVLEAGGTALLATAKGLGSNVLQLLIQLVMTAA